MTEGSSSQPLPANGDAAAQDLAASPTLPARLALALYRNPRLLLVLIGLILAAGLAAYHSLPRQEDPRLATRWGAIVVAWPGHNAERVEALVTEPLETRLEEVDEIGEFVSIARPGFSSITIELADRVHRDEVDRVWSRIRDKVRDARGDLPPDASEPRLLTDQVHGVTLIAALVWDSPDPSNRGLLTRLAQRLEDTLIAIDGTEFVERFAYAQEEIRLELDRQTLTGLNLSPRDVANRLAAADGKLAAGNLRSEQNRFLLEVRGEFTDLDRLARLPLARGPQQQTLHVADLGKLHKTTRDPPHELAFVDGRPAVVVAARLHPETRADRWIQRVNAALDTFRTRLTQGVSLQVIHDQTRYTAQALATLQRNFLLGIAAVLVVNLLCMGWRASLIVSATLPLVSLAVLFGFFVLEIPIHGVSIAGLIIALGLLIDNPIIMVDLIRRNLQRDRNPELAIRHAVGHLALPLGASTLTTVLAFGPIALMPGPTGEFVGALAISVTLAVICSYALAILAVPALVALSNRTRNQPKTTTEAAAIPTQQPGLAHGLAHPAVTAAYQRVLAALLRYPVLAIALALTPPALGFAFSGQLVEQFFPPAERDQFHARIELPRSADIRQTAATAHRVREILLQDPEIERVHLFVGNAVPIFYYNFVNRNAERSPFLAEAIVDTRSEHPAPTINRLQTRLDEAVPEAHIILRQLEQGPPFVAPVEVRLAGPDLHSLRRLGEQIRLQLAQSDHVRHTETSLQTAGPQLHVELHEPEAASLGLTARGIADQLRSQLDGATGGSLREGRHELPIRVRLDDPARGDPEAIATLPLVRPGSADPQQPGQTQLVTSEAFGAPEGQSGAAGFLAPAAASSPQASQAMPLPLQAVADLELQPRLAAIERLDGQRINRILGYTAAGVLPELARRDFEQRLADAEIHLPPGYRLTWGGESDQRDKAVSNLAVYVPLLMLLMLASLVFALGSFRHTAIIVGVGIASVGLALLALFLAEQPLGFMAIIGVMGLIGVAINDSIVVLVALHADPDARQGDLSATVRVTLQATRHVLATTFTTIAGFFPLLLAGGNIWPPVAITISGGVLGATLLALTFTPATYRLIHPTPTTRPQ